MQNLISHHLWFSIYEISPSRVLSVWLQRDCPVCFRTILVFMWELKPAD